MPLHPLPRATRTFIRAHPGWLGAASALCLLLAACSTDRRSAPTSPLASTDGVVALRHGPAGARSSGEPVPIPGGTQIPGGPLIHTFLPGPVPIGQGLDVDP